MEKTKVLLTGLSSNCGGIEMYFLNLVKNCDLKKFEIYVLDAREKNNKIAYCDEFIKLRCKVLKITNRHENFIQHKKDLIRIFKEYKFDIMHYSIMDYNWFEPITLANKYSRTKIIIHSHNAGGKSKKKIKDRILSCFGRKKIKKIKCFKIACGKRAGQYMFGDSKYLVFYNGINIDNYKFSTKLREKYRKQYAIKENEILIGNVARLSLQKNPLFLVELYNCLYKINNNYKLILVGDGALKANVESRIKELKLEENVILAGNQKNANEYYSMMDIYVMPSLYEGFSLSMIEAITNGLKCYTSTAVDDEVNILGNVTFLDLNNSPKEWANKINKLDNSRTIDADKIIPNKFVDQTSYQAIFDYYREILEK